MHKHDKLAVTGNILAGNKSWFQIMTMNMSKQVTGWYRKQQDIQNNH
jgi:hypothetical protein